MYNVRKFWHRTVSTLNNRIIFLVISLERFTTRRNSQGYRSSKIHIGINSFIRLVIEIANSSVTPGYRETHNKIVLHEATGIGKLTLSVTPG